MLHFGNSYPHRRQKRNSRSVWLLVTPGFQYAVAPDRNRTVTVGLAALASAEFAEFRFSDVTIPVGLFALAKDEGQEKS